MELSKRKETVKVQQYSFSLLAAISQDQIISHQVIEGGVDSVMFEHYVYKTLLVLKDDPQNEGKQIVLFMDNAVIHKQSVVKETASKMGVHVLFNAEYSPWLNPIELLFNHIKKKLKDQVLTTSK